MLGPKMLMLKKQKTKNKKSKSMHSNYLLSTKNESFEMDGTWQTKSFIFIVVPQSE